MEKKKKKSIDNYYTAEGNSMYEGSAGRYGLVENVQFKVIRFLI